MTGLSLSCDMPASIISIEYVKIAVRLRLVSPAESWLGRGSRVFRHIWSGLWERSDELLQPDRHSPVSNGDP